MAFDFLPIPAMSSKYERVFLSCVKETTPESSRLSGPMLWHQEYLKKIVGKKGDFNITSME
jgi:hypothetical protein